MEGVGRAMATPKSKWAELQRRLYPTGFLNEFRILSVMAAPLIVFQLSQSFMGPVAVMFCGRLGETELDAVALAISVINVTGISVATGVASSCETLFAQMFGSKHKKNLGILLQKAVCFVPICVFPCWAIQFNAENFLIAIGQDPEVSEFAADFLDVACPGLFFYFLSIVLAKYMQCQSVVLPNMVVGIAANVVNVLLQLLFVTYLGYGVRGSALALCITYVMFFLFSLIYILMSKMYKETWNGWSTHCFSEWGHMVLLAAYGVCMMCGSWIAIEASVFIAGLLGPVELGAQSVIFQIETIVYMIPMGFGIAACVRVGQYLGAGSADGAKTVTYVALSIGACIGLTIAILEGCLKDYLPLIFTNVQDVVGYSARILPVLATYYFFESGTNVTANILRGCGRQIWGAAIMLVSVLSLFVSLPVMFLTEAGMLGFWYVFAAGMFIQTSIFLAVISRTNWDNLIKQAAERNMLLRGEEGEDTEDEEEGGTEPSTDEKKGTISLTASVVVNSYNLGDPFLHSTSSTKSRTGKASFFSPEDHHGLKREHHKNSSPFDVSFEDGEETPLLGYQGQDACLSKYKAASITIPILFALMILGFACRASFPIEPIGNFTNSTGNFSIHYSDMFDMANTTNY